MDSHHTGVLLAGLVGFMVGGILADTVTRFARVLIATGTIGGFLGGAVGAMLNRDVTDTAAAGSGLGVAFGLVIVLIDPLVGG
jgi:hypothetical protein